MSWKHKSRQTFQNQSVSFIFEVKFPVVVWLNCTQCQSELSSRQSTHCTGDSRDNYSNDLLVASYEMTEIMQKCSSQPCGPGQYYQLRSCLSSQKVNWKVMRESARVCHGSHCQQCNSNIVVEGCLLASVLTAGLYCTAETPPYCTLYTPPLYTVH